MDPREASGGGFNPTKLGATLCLWEMRVLDILTYMIYVVFYLFAIFFLMKYFLSNLIISFVYFVCFVKNCSCIFVSLLVDL